MKFIFVDWDNKKIQIKPGIKTPNAGYQLVGSINHPDEARIDSKIDPLFNGQNSDRKINKQGPFTSTETL